MPLFKDYLVVKKKQWGGDDPRYAGQLAIFAFELLKYEQYAAAEPMLRECLDIRAKKQPDAWSSFNTKAQLGGSLLGQKKYKDAEPLLNEGYEGMKQREKTMPPRALPRLTEALDRLVQLYEATGNGADADRWRKELSIRNTAAKE